MMRLGPSAKAQVKGAILTTPGFATHFVWSDCVGDCFTSAVDACGSIQLIKAKKITVISNHSPCSVELPKVGGT